MMTTEAELDVMLGRVRDWFTTVHRASLELPSRWFGRPYDNLHALTWAQLRGQKILLELDDRLMLIITAPHEVRVDGSSLYISGFRQLVFDWQEYGDDKVHAEVFGEGELRFVA